MKIRKTFTIPTGAIVADVLKEVADFIQLGALGLKALELHVVGEMDGVERVRAPAQKIQRRGKKATELAQP